MFGIDRCRRIVRAILLLSVLVINARTSSLSPRDAARTVYATIEPTTVDLRTKEKTSHGEQAQNVSTTKSLTPVAMCCPINMRLNETKCVQANGTYRFPPIYDSSSFALLVENLTLDDVEWIVEDPCEGEYHHTFNPDENPEEDFILLQNGSLYLKQLNQTIDRSNYCFSVVDDEMYNAWLCFPSEGQDPVGIPVGLIVSVPFLFATFLVYSLLPELKNMHGLTLRAYVGSLLVAYSLLGTVQITPQEKISDNLCTLLAFIIHFSFLASFFWLNVMCFDIWWTFGGFRALRGTVKQRERKKFVIYSIYAWGCASVLSGVCIIMDLLPSIPDYFIRPEFGAQSCWFATDMARAIYFYGPMGITVACNICLFILTAVKIVQHKNDTAHHLKGVDSRRHDDNKQWFNLYLKLFIVMGITWSMEIISWLFNNSPSYIWYLSDLVNTLQGVIIFLIFVWKQKIRRLLLKRLGCQGRDFLSRNSTRSAYHSSASRTCTTSAAPLQEKITSYNCEAHRPGKQTTNHDSA